MDHRRIHRDHTTSALIAVAIGWIAVTVLLFHRSFVQHLIRDVDPGWINTALSTLTIIWWCLTAWLITTLVRRISHRFLFPSDDQPKRRKILSDLFSALIYLGALLGILKYGLHQPVTGLVATSGIVALVLGLALQSTLSDLFSGIALNIERPFRAGDWISVDGTSEGQVIETNWRATRLRDGNSDITIIPNSQIAKSRVTNHCLPERLHCGSIAIDCDSREHSAAIEAILISAALGAERVLNDPPPTVAVQGLRGNAATYCLSFYVADFADLSAAQSYVLKRLLSFIEKGELRPVGPQTDVVLVREAPNHQDQIVADGHPLARSVPKESIT